MVVGKISGLSHLFMTVFLYNFSIFSVIPAITDVTMSALCPGQDECSLAIYLSGFQQAIVGLGTLVMMPLVGNLSDKYGRKALLALPMTLTIIPLVVLAYSRTKKFFYMYYVLKTLTGMICEGSVHCLALAYVADNIPEIRRVSAFGILSGIGSSAFVCATLSARFLSTSSTFQVSASVAVIAAVYMKVFLPDSVIVDDECLIPRNAQENLVDKHTDGDAKKNLFRTLPSLEDILSLLKSSKTFSQAAIVAFFCNLADSGLHASLMYYLKARFHFNKDQFADLMVIFGLAGTISQLLFMPILASAIGEGKLLSVGLLFSFTHMFLYSVAWSSWVPYAAAMFTVLSVFASPCIRSIVSNQVGPSEQGKAQGCISGICSFSSVVAPLIFTPLTALFLSERAPFNFPGFSILCIGFASAGVMQTHDEETRKFFKHSSVTCVLSPRYASSKLSIFKQKVVGTLFTHHQKCVIVDTQASGNNRKITSFIGGLDLCDGRYDTPEHRLFRDLDTIFQDDYHNPTFPSGVKGPRQPWHDLHCKIEGPAAYDVLTNFEQRWRKATKWSEFGQRFKRISHWHDDALIKIERISWILSPSQSIPNDDPLLWASNEEDSENWHVQIFRSIDSGSVTGFPKNVYAAEAKNLVCAKNLVIDKSIQTAYIQAIRSAQHFIYIENQYFLGSSFAWPCYRYAGAINLIPMELALKIASKIRAKERFAVYVVIPMWPEGVPSSASVQEILYWQGQTMQLMYEIIARELRSVGLEDSHPQEYLNFFCLGNREELHAEVSSSTNQSSSNGDAVSDSQKFQRFMIYVHAKGMIVDDEYVILGSANINERSMAGSRDTEIAMGAYQPHHTWAKKKHHPRGQVYGYRMSLWAEHLGMLHDCFKVPESSDCLKRVTKIAKDNWEKFTTEEFTPLQGHLLKYPIEVDDNGKVSALPGHENFPDVGGKVLGVRSNLPDSLTT